MCGNIAAATGTHATDWGHLAEPLIEHENGHVLFM